MLFRQDEFLSSQRGKLLLFHTHTLYIDWFASIDEKPLYKVVQFNIIEFYPSIKRPLLEKALKFAEKYIEIPIDDKTIINYV